MADVNVAVLLYGYGAELGNFKFFADDLATELVKSKKFDKANIIIKETLSRDAFFQALQDLSPNQKIKELHVFSHSIGAGLYVGYHETTATANRMAAMQRYQGTSAKITYQEVLDAETGGILTDHLSQAPLKGLSAQLKLKFAPGASLKIWGCNAGVSGWVYSDVVDAAGTRFTSDENESALVYYWRALNTQNTPKPSISQALADYFGVPVLGAGSGSHIEVRHEGKWLKSDVFKSKTGKWAGEPHTLRLHPDKGDFNEFKPATP